MGDQPVPESWFSGLWRGSANESPDHEKALIGILAFEISSLMSKLVTLWHLLGDRQILRLKDELSCSVGMKKLVSEDISVLMNLVYAEVIDTLQFVASSVVRIGKRCMEPGYHHLDFVFSAVIESDGGSFGWEYKMKKMERKVRKMEKFVAATGQLYRELDVLSDLERTFSRMQRCKNMNRVELLDFHQKVIWKRQEVKNLQEMSTWNRNYDYVILLLSRCIVTVAERIKHVFRSPVEDIKKDVTKKHLSRSISYSLSSVSLISCSESNPLSLQPCLADESLQHSGVKNDGQNYGEYHHQPPYLHRKNATFKAKGLPSMSPFKGCMMGVSDSPVLKGCMLIDATIPTNGAIPKKLSKIKSVNSRSISAQRLFDPKLSLPVYKCKLLKAPNSTLGDAALAHHYANVVIMIERLVVSPPCVSLDGINDLYNMLPAALRAKLRARLKPFTKLLDYYVYNAALAVEWSLALENILEWLAPLAHNMMRWQSERNFEKHKMGTSSNIFLVQTIYFASLEKTESAIAELLVGLNYIWRFGRDLDKKTLV